MSDENEGEVYARNVMAREAQRREKIKQKVIAHGHRYLLGEVELEAKQQAGLNKRYLKATIQSVALHNRLDQEEQCWRALRLERRGRPRPGGGGGGGGAGGSAAEAGYEHDRNAKFAKAPFKPDLKPGQLPGQEAVKVSAWTVGDVARWLQTLKLSQYQEAFVDAAVDGEFLYDLDDDDLKNTLGVEHRLHRKKILNFVARLKRAEFEHDQQLRRQMRAGGGGGGAGPSAVNSYMDPAVDAADPALGDPGTAALPPGALAAATVGADDPAAQARAAVNALDIKEIVGWVRHGKFKKIAEALDPLPNRKFDPALVRVPYVEDFGTAYQEAYEREVFNLNKADDFGNTPLLVAGQNGNRKIAALLVQKGANPNHQNQQGQTAGHYALAYQFFDFSSWLFDPAGGGGDDTIENRYGLGVYDGLAPEGGGYEEGGAEYPALTEG
mmetsp:Transcript_25188/g.41645  ORF Transcript_25188/g.41645 Transcript_25188/m.41645 type:complete len:440 (-) Transcript_25188:324-1643(-)